MNWARTTMLCWMMWLISRHFYSYEKHEKKIYREKLLIQYPAPYPYKRQRKRKKNNRFQFFFGVWRAMSMRDLFSLVFSLSLFFPLYRSQCLSLVLFLSRSLFLLSSNNFSQWINWPSIPSKFIHSIFWTAAVRLVPLRTVIWRKHCFHPTRRQRPLSQIQNIEIEPLWYG